MRIKHEKIPEKFVSSFLSFHRFERDALQLKKKGKYYIIRNETIANFLGMV